MRLSDPFGNAFTIEMHKPLDRIMANSYCFLCTMLMVDLPAAGRCVGLKINGQAALKLWLSDHVSYIGRYSSRRDSDPGTLGRVALQVPVWQSLPQNSQDWPKPSSKIRRHPAHPLLRALSILSAIIVLLAQSGVRALRA